MIWLKYVIVAAVAYLLGNISTGVIVSRAFSHTDIRKHGSGNAGATNMLRTLGWAPSLMTLAGDALKAVAAALIGRGIAGEIGTMIAGVCVILGHNWPVLLNFKGGKGIAASLGFIIVTDPIAALILFAQEIALIAVTRYVSVGSISSAILYPVITIIRHWGNAPRIITSLILGGLALFSHRANIARLISGNENRLDFGKIKEISKKKGEKRK